jgi:hypothetical protein
VPLIRTKLAKQKPIKSGPEVLDDATRRLLKGIKANANKMRKPLDSAELLRRGYPKEFISQLEAA